MGKHGHKILDIEALRGVSILLVLLAHSPAIVFWAPSHFLMSMDKNFGVGVDLFFCISGFVISLTLVESIDRARMRGAPAIWGTLKQFWLRRAFRLLPTACVWIAL